MRSPLTDAELRNFFTRIVRVSEIRGLVDEVLEHRAAEREREAKP